MSVTEQPPSGDPREALHDRIAADSLTTRRDYLRIVTTVSGGLAVGGLGVAAGILPRHGDPDDDRTPSPKRIAAQLLPGESVAFHYPDEEDKAVAVRLDDGTLMRLLRDLYPSRLCRALAQGPGLRGRAVLPLPRRRLRRPYRRGHRRAAAACAAQGGAHRTGRRQHLGHRYDALGRERRAGAVPPVPRRPPGPRLPHRLPRRRGRRRGGPAAAEPGTARTEPRTEAETPGRRT